MIASVSINYNGIHPVIPARAFDEGHLSIPFEFSQPFKAQLGDKGTISTVTPRLTQ